MNEQFNLSTSEGFTQAFGRFSYLKEKGATVEINEIKPTRSSQQNRALHLYFTFCANALNDAGIEFAYRGIKGMDIEIPWTADLFKQMVWKQVQKTIFEDESTTMLTTQRIDIILEILTRHFANMGLDVVFPNKFDLLLKKLGY